MSGPQFNPSIPFDGSPHYSERQGHDVVATIIHFTAGASAGSSIAWSKNPLSKASWHFIIDRDGKCGQQVALEQAAWHAGAASLTYKGAGSRAVNQCTLGIELANHGLLHKNTDGSFAYEAGNTLMPYTGATPELAELRFAAGAQPLSGFWEPFSKVQMDKLTWLLDQLSKSGYGRATSNLMGHEEVASPPGRKTDPGPLFPWHLFGRPNGRLTSSSILTPTPY